MFPSTTNTRTAQPSWRDRLRRAADTARAFVLLEDPIWEDGLEARGPHGGPAGHPHREPLRAPLRARRPGAAQPRPQVCVTPLRTAATRPAPRSRAPHV